MVSEHCGQLKFHLLSTSNCAIKACLAIVSKYRNLKMHSQHFFSVKILSSVRKNEVACQQIQLLSFIFSQRLPSRLNIHLSFFLKNYPDLSADSVFIFCFHQTCFALITRCSSQFQWNKSAFGNSIF